MLTMNLVPCVSILQSETSMTMKTNETKEIHNHNTHLNAGIRPAIFILRILITYSD